MHPTRILAHICCAPCATYSVERLRSQGWEIAGHWFNPNIHPFSEQERRRETLARYAAEIELPMVWEPGYAMPAFLEAVAGHARFRERCLICYRLRLARTVEVAVEQGYGVITTTLLISPYQDQAALRRIGEELAGARGIAFYYENLRRGYADSRRMARERGLYMQRYCGCLYSEWEAATRQAHRSAAKNAESTED